MIRTNDLDEGRDRANVSGTKEGIHSMNAWKLGIASLVVVASLAGSSSAQTSKPNTLNRGQSVDSGARNSGNYYNLANCFDPLGVSGIYPGYLGFGLSGYGPGATLSNQFAPWPVAKVSQTSSLIPKNDGPKSPKTSSSRTSPGPKAPVARKSSRK